MPFSCDECFGSDELMSLEDLQNVLMAHASLLSSEFAYEPTEGLKAFRREILLLDPEETRAFFHRYGRDGGARTRGLLVPNQALYQLSYVPT